jgi:hypothetical protein
LTTIVCPFCEARNCVHSAQAGSVITCEAPGCRRLIAVTPAPAQVPASPPVRGLAAGAPETKDEGAGRTD